MGNTALASLPRIDKAPSLSAAAGANSDGIPNGGVDGRVFVSALFNCQ